MSIKRNGVGKMPRPLNVEWPFACILPDLIKAELTIAVEEANKREAQLNREVKPSLSLLESLKASLGRFMKSTLKHLNIDEPILDWLADRVTYAADTKEEKAAEIRAQNLKEAEKLRTKINNDRDATQFVLASMLNTVEEMQVAYRSSKIEPADVKKEA
ncbi:MAG TPA: hypothetical protein VNT99_19335, partial [Methylomirabilota bacterium]|nr:hypothetical protein [Methylomirabilota bacterium]